MAELHRRVLRFQSRKGLRKALLAVLTIGLAALALPAFAQDTAEIGVDEIVGWAGDLRSTDGVRRERAVQRLGHLPATALPGIQARLRDTRRQIIPSEDGYDAFRYFRHAVGSRRADDMVDIAPGILPVLEERRSPVIGRAAERLLLLRSLESIGTVPAMILMGDVLALTPPMWRWERRRLLERMGERLVPGLIALRGHDQQAVRSWARGALSQVGRAEPGQAVQEEDPELLAGILTAYGEIHDMNAMTVVISFVGHADDRVRTAARNAMTSYGRNGIWQLREAMRNQLGQEADHAWGWRHTADVLYSGLDEQRLGPATAQLERGLSAMPDDPQAARLEFEALLVTAPNHPRLSELAPHFAAFAERSQDNAERQRLLQRALWFAPDHPAAREWQAALERAEDEHYRSQGLALASAAISQDSQLATEVIADEPAESESFAWTWAFWLGTLLMGVTLMVMLRGKAQAWFRARGSTSTSSGLRRRRATTWLSSMKVLAGARAVSVLQKSQSLLHTLGHLVGRSMQDVKKRSTARTTAQTAARTPAQTTAQTTAQTSARTTAPDPVSLKPAMSKRVELAPAEADARLFFGTSDPMPDTPEPLASPAMDLFLESNVVAPAEDPTTLHDFVPTGLLVHDTSPGTIEAPDTLPG